MGNILIVTEIQNGAIRECSYELVTLAQGLGGTVKSLVIGSGVGDLASDFASKGGGETFVADDAGLFEEAGLDVRLVPFNTAAEKDIALAAGEIDGTFGDLFTTLVIAGNGVEVAIVATNYDTSSDRHMFALVGRPGGPATLGALRGVPVAMSSNSVVHFVASKLLAPEGVEVLEAKKNEGRELKEVTYAVDPDGRYELVSSSGWEPKNISNHQAWEVIAAEVEEVRQKVVEGRLSPLAYHMSRNLMDISLLAGYMNMFRWRVKRHFKPQVFNKLNPEILKKYADLFKISVEQLKDISKLSKMKIPGQENI